MSSYGEGCIGQAKPCRTHAAVTPVITKFSSHLLPDMYNLGAFDFAVVSSTLL
jgi:hypothetical protein